MQSNFLADNAKTALEKKRQEQEARKQTMLRNEKMKELQQLETQLFYKKQEVLRLKTSHDRLRREAVIKQNKEIKEKHEVQNQKRQLEETEKRIHALDQEVSKTLGTISDKISKEKLIIAEHERNLENLEKEKRQVEAQEVIKERSLKESLSRILFFKKKEENEERTAEKLFHSNQEYLNQTEKSLKSFSQEVIVLENKVRSLRSSFH